MKYQVEPSTKHWGQEGSKFMRIIANRGQRSVINNTLDFDHKGS